MINNKIYVLILYVYTCLVVLGQTNDLIEVFPTRFANHAIGKKAILFGIMTDVNYAKESVNLIFKRNDKPIFTAMIHNDDVQVHNNWERLGGKMIEISGQVVNNHGLAQIALTNLNQVQILEYDRLSEETAIRIAALKDTFEHDENMGSSLFSVRDMSQLLTVIKKLEQPNRTIDHYLAEQLAPIKQRVLSKYSDPSLVPTMLQLVIVENMNIIIRGPTIYNDKRFENIPLRTETRRLIVQNPQNYDIWRLNRLLLEDAYPMELAEKLKKTDFRNQIIHLESDLAHENIARAFAQYPMKTGPVAIEEISSFEMRDKNSGKIIVLWSVKVTARNADKTQVQVDCRHGPLKGYGKLVTLKRKNGTWIVISTISNYIS